MERPTITVTLCNEYLAEYRIEGGTLREDWAKSLRPGETPFCRLTVWHRPGNQISSYGGSVWPTAWPELFLPLPSNPQAGSGRIEVTAIGEEALSLARAAWADSKRAA